MASAILPFSLDDIFLLISRPLRIRMRNVLYTLMLSMKHEEMMALTASMTGAAAGAPDEHAVTIIFISLSTSVTFRV